MGTIPKSFGLEAATQGSLDGKGQCRKICTDTETGGILFFVDRWSGCAPTIGIFEFSRGE
jgi:hypothetical protein